MDRLTSITWNDKLYSFHCLWSYIRIYERVIKPLQVFTTRLGVVELSHKTIFFLQTNKGGGKNTSRSQLIPIARLFQRRLLWLSGLAENFLSGQNTDFLVPFKNKNYGVEDVAIHDILFFVLLFVNIYVICWNSKLCSVIHVIIYYYLKCIFSHY